MQAVVRRPTLDTFVSRGISTVFNSKHVQYFTCELHVSSTVCGVCVKYEVNCNYDTKFAVVVYSNRCVLIDSA